MLSRERLTRYFQQNTDLQQQLLQLHQWIAILKQLCQKQFCLRHHSHRNQQQFVDFLQVIIKYQRNSDYSTKEEKLERLTLFVDHMKILNPEIDVYPALYKKACDLKKSFRIKKKYVIDSMSKKPKDALKGQLIARKISKKE